MRLLFALLASAQLFAYSTFAELPKTVGMYTCLDMKSALTQFPDNTTYLSYVAIDREASANQAVSYMAARRQIQIDLQRDLRLQLAVEILDMNLDQFIAAMENPESTVRRNIKVVADGLKKERGIVYIRPFSEMNDSDLESVQVWKLMKGPAEAVNSTAKFARAWTMLVDAFREAGVTNARYHFNVLAALNVGPDPLDPANRELTFDAFEKIPPGYVTDLGFNVYARPIGAGWSGPQDTTQNGTFQTDYFTFSELVQPWLDRLATSSQPGLGLVVGEMGVSNQGQDEKKALWIRQAFEYSRAHTFNSVTYFNCTGVNWGATPGSFAELSLKKQFSLGL